MELAFSFFLVDRKSFMVLLCLIGGEGDLETEGDDSRRRCGFGGGLVPDISGRAIC